MTHEANVRSPGVMVLGQQKEMSTACDCVANTQISHRRALGQRSWRESNDLTTVTHLAFEAFQLGRNAFRAGQRSAVEPMWTTRTRRLRLFQTRASMCVSAAP